MTKKHVLESQGEVFEPRNSVPAVKYGGGSIMLSVCVNFLPLLGKDGGSFSDERRKKSLTG